MIAENMNKPEARTMDLETTDEAVIAVDVRRMSSLVPFSVRTLRRMDSAGRMPRGFRVGGKKLWRISDLKLWAQLGFPRREKFEALVKSGLA